MGIHTMRNPGSLTPYRRRPRYILRYVVTPVLLVITGIAIMLTPVAVTQFHNLQQTQAAREYSDQMRQLEAAERDRQWEDAREWNASASIPVAEDPWLNQQPAITTTDPEYLSYLEQLNITPVMARIRVPAVHIDLPVYHGTEEQTLSQGVGHLYGTGLPVGGAGTHTVLTGHTGIATATLFDNLVDITEGDFMAVDVLDETLTYRVTQIQTVLPHETDALRVVADGDLLTLITCTPYGLNTHRLLVTGERLNATAPPAQDSSFSWQPWMIQAISASALLIVGVFSVWIYRHRKERR